MGRFALPPEGNMFPPSDLVEDSDGDIFSPASCGHSYTWENGKIKTDTAVDQDGVQRVKTFTWVNGVLTAESSWVAI